MLICSASTHAFSLKEHPKENSLVLQWLGLSAFTAQAWVQSLVRELRSCRLHGTAQKKKKKITQKRKQVIILYIIGLKRKTFRPLCKL